MAWRIPLSSTTAGVNADLGTTDSLYISATTTLGSTSGRAVQSSGSNHIVYVYGTAVSVGGNTIQIEGDFANDTSNNVTIGKFGRVDSLTNSGVVIHSKNSVLANSGDIIANSYGVAWLAISANTTSKIINSGTIEGRLGAIIQDSNTATETLEIINSGLITSAGRAVDGLGSNAKELITNTGNMIGIIKLDGGDDVYNGINGHQTGVVNGGNGVDRLYGGSEANNFHGDAGADNLQGYAGNDTLFGDADNDLINGGLGADSLTGGTGLDNFIYNTFNESTVALAGQDTIVDFHHAEGDKINLFGIDARAGTVANEAFSFIGLAAFTGVKGQLHYAVTGGQTFVSGDINGDTIPDFMIHVQGNVALVGGDFIL